MTSLPIGRLAAHAEEIRNVVLKRTQLEVDIVDNELLMKYDIADTEHREELLNIVCQQALDHARELGI